MIVFFLDDKNMMKELSARWQALSKEEKKAYSDKAVEDAVSQLIC
jgi:hypothetical protein